MQYQRTNEANTSGSSLLGVLSDIGASPLTVDQIELVFPNGECEDGDGKVDYHWTFCSDNDDIFTVYNYKHNPINQPYNWHIGGFKGSSWKDFAFWFVVKVLLNEYTNECITTKSLYKEMKMFGLTEKMILDLIEDKDAIEMIVIAQSILSDSQEQVQLNNTARSRQLVNVAKFILDEVKDKIKTHKHLIDCLLLSG